MSGQVREVQVPCPECCNLNRAARRACRYCKRTGWVTKFVPYVNDPDAARGEGR